MKLKYLLSNLLILLALQALAQEPISILRYIEKDAPATFDPITVKDPSSIKLTELLFARLYTQNRYVERVPELADGEPELRNDNRVAIVKLKPGIKFSDGTPITADDVVFTFKAAINPQSDTFNKSVFENIADIKALDQYTVEVDFTYPVMDAKKYLMFFIIPKDAFLSPKIRKTLSYCRNPEPVSGGYKLKVSSIVGTRYQLEKNNYYKGTQEPKIHEVEMNVYPNPRGHVDQLRNNQIDLLPFVLPEALSIIRNDFRFKLEAYDANQYDFIAFNLKNDLLKFVQIRQAMNLAFNRRDVLESFFLNEGELMSGPFPSSHPGYNSSVRPWEFDRNMAKTILDHSGFVDSDGDGIRDFNGKPLEFRLLAGLANDQNYNAIINAFIQQMKLIGIKIKLNSFLADIFEEKLIRGDFDLVYFNIKVTPAGDYSPFFLSSEAYPGGKNIGYYYNPVVDTLFLQAKLTTDFQLQTQILQDVHKVLREDCPWIFLWYLRYHAAYVRKLKNVTINPFFFFTTIEEWFYER
ncbi:ABC-type transporter, periplasmic subunit [Caldithrix abyssi DSM 13497]|uniref:ABC-type transport system, substrate-binding protein n=1 Tax=Caldithrix abyssi DSM 13497 TaxID=880073 RepID=H1XNX0_CALAY|nr:ABC transporter substrate-binding protein [Caldithrix abyssi]APF19806.1 ABC-type transport system, substrate-binding protein [Caldithrix abyssi DSM 13497]EHO39910.1 ABC-type transporter, periplasmic subunit [Caldithrix abyssi DSM 13497]